MNPDIPEGFEKLFGSFGGFGGFESIENKPMVPRVGMTTEELIRCAEHNARLINNRSQKVNKDEK